MESRIMGNMLFSSILLTLFFVAGCASRPVPLDVSGLAVLRLESIDLDADRIEFALYNTSELPLRVRASGDDYLGEVVVLSGDEAAVFMVQDVALARLEALLAYESTRSLKRQACVRWSLPLSEMVRINGDRDMESLLLDERIQRREDFERDPDAYRRAHGIPQDSTPLFTDEERIPLPPTLLNYLKASSRSAVAVQPMHIVIGMPSNGRTASYGPFRERSNWVDVSP